MRIAKWGNSLAVRLPKQLVDDLSLKVGDEVAIVEATRERLGLAKDERRKQALDRTRGDEDRPSRRLQVRSGRDQRALTVFLDTNLFVYAMSGDARGIVARDRLSAGGVISAQVLNEFVRVSRKKLRLDWAIVAASLAEFLALVDDVRPVARTSSTGGGSASA